MSRLTYKEDRGVALLTATLFIAVATLVLGLLSIRAITQNRQVDQYARFQECFQGLEAGLAQGKLSIEMGNSGCIGLEGWASPGGDLPAFDETGISPLRLSTMPGVEYFTFAMNWQTDGIDNNGNGVIDDITEQGRYTIYPFARCANVVRRSEVVMEGSDVNVWRNAIFGGTGQTGGLINGNVSIHGSVHLLGDSIPEGGEAVTAIDLSGTSLIHNNYTGLTADLASRVPALPTTLFNGETVSTLNAKLRVKNGLVGMSGNSEIGEANLAGNAIKETMDATYVNDGWTGTSVVDDGDRGDPKNLYSDNGWDSTYDLGTKVELPVFADDYRELGTGARTINPATGKYYTHSEFFHSQLAGTPLTGDVTIKASQNFYYNATRPTDTNPANRQASDSYIYFNATTNVMEVHGQIEINGNLTITRGSGNDKTISYTGRAAILTTGSVTLDTDLLSQNSDGTTANSFPANNCLGIMAGTDMVVGSLSQLQLMGAFYAQNKIRTEKQSTIMGTFVSNYFDMGTNVPSIYQVPTLADNLPRGMIGAYPILNLGQVAWREIGV